MKTPVHNELKQCICCKVALCQQRGRWDIREVMNMNSFSIKPTTSTIDCRITLKPKTFNLFCC